MLSSKYFETPKMLDMNQQYLLSLPQKHKHLKKHGRRPGFFAMLLFIGRRPSEHPKVSRQDFLLPFSTYNQTDTYINILYNTLI